MSSSSKKIIMIGVFTRGRDIDHRLVTFLVEQSRCADFRTMLLFGQCSYSVFSTFKSIWRESGKHKWDYLMLFDSDIIPPHGLISHFVKHDVPVVVPPIWYCDAYKGDIHVGVHYTDEKDRVYKVKDSGLERIQGASVSACMIRRDVFDMFQEKGESPIYWSPMISEEYKDTLTDNVFYAKLRKWKVPVYVDWDIKNLIHNTTVPLCTDTIHRLIRRYNEVT